MLLSSFLFSLSPSLSRPSSPLLSASLFSDAHDTLPGAGSLLTGPGTCPLVKSVTAPASRARRNPRSQTPNGEDARRSFQELLPETFEWNFQSLVLRKVQGPVGTPAIHFPEPGLCSQGQVRARR